MYCSTGHMPVILLYYCYTLDKVRSDKTDNSVTFVECCSSADVYRVYMRNFAMCELYVQCACIPANSTADIHLV